MRKNFFRIAFYLAVVASAVFSGGLAGAATSGQLTWPTGFGFAAGTPQIIGNTDTDMFVQAASGKNFNFGGNAATQWQVTSAGALTGQIAGAQLTWKTGLGGINHIVSPTDQPLAIASANAQNITIVPDTTGSVLVGSATLSGSRTSAQLQMASNALVYNMGLDEFATGEPPAFRFGRGRGTIGSPSSVTNGDGIIDLAGEAYIAGTGGSNFNPVGHLFLKMDASGTVSATSGPSMWTFDNVPNGSLTTAVVWAIRSTGNLVGGSGVVSGWSSAADPSTATAIDTGFSRYGAASAALGNGTAGDASGTLKLTNLTSPAATTLSLQFAGTATYSIVGAPTASAATSLAQTTGINGSTYTVGVIHNSVTTSSGSSVSLANAVPAGSTILGVTYRITTTVTGPTGNLQLQDQGGANTYLAQGTLTAGTTAVGGPFGTAPAAFFNNFYNAANTFVVSSSLGAFTGGVVEVEIYYATIKAPTS